MQIENKTTGVYVHIPFCVQKCPYCDFYSVVGNAPLYDAYTAAVLRCIGTTPYQAAVDSIYFGGGTPNLLGAARLGSILGALKATFVVAEDCEITLEANPYSVNLALLEKLVSVGFNRISFGLQATNQKTLSTLGRLHTINQGFEAVHLAKKAGFAHISVDVMLGVPNQTVQEAALCAEEIAALPIDHVSAYMLKLEQGTPFYATYQELDEDLLCDCYEAFSAKLAGLGFVQYEISSFALGNAQSRHNMKYWQLKPYIGIGPAAHGFVEGKRYYFPSSIDAFVAAENVWALAVNDGVGGSFEEAVMLGLRLREGVDCTRLAIQYGDIANLLSKKIEPFLAMHFAELENGVIRLTAKGFLISNTIINALLT